MNLLRKKVSKDTLFSEYAKIVNGVLELSPRVLEVFSFLLLADGEGERADINNKVVRSRIISKFNISAANLSRYLKVLRDKGLSVRNERGKWVLNDVIRPIMKDGKLELKFILEVDDAIPGNSSAGFSSKV
jgi:DNA-binding transcriptional ArsR family regulator